MKINKRLLVEAIIVSVLIILLGFGWMIIQGYLITKNRLPEILNHYESVEYLNTSAEFGVDIGFNWTSTIIPTIGVVIFAAAYYGLRILMNRLIQKKRA